MKEEMNLEDVMNLYHLRVSEVLYLIEELGLPVEPRLPGEEFRFSREKLNKWHLHLPFNLQDMFNGANGRRLTMDEVLDEYAISKEKLLDAVKFNSIPYTYSLPCTFLFDRKDIEVFLKTKAKRRGQEMNRSYQIKREVLAEKEEQERAMRAQIRALRFKVKDLAKTISATLAADPVWCALPKCERDCVLGLMVGLFRQNLN